MLWAALIFSVAVPSAKELLAVSEAWEPYMGPNLPDQGFFSALVKRAFQGTGHTVRVEFYPWARAFAMVKEGKADILIAAYKNDERLAWFEFTSPIAEVTDSLFALRKLGVSRYRDLRELAPYAAGVVRNAAHGDAFDRAVFLRKEEAVSNLQNLEKLIAGRVPLIAGPREVIRRLIAERYPAYAESIVELVPPLHLGPVHLAVSKRRADARELAARADAEVNKVKESGEYEALAKRHGILLP
jgi:polar amino acid transport system substrate-binding protein